MKHFLIVVDMQKDFVDGALGTKEAVAIAPYVAEKIRRFDGEIFATLDTHYENYMEIIIWKQWIKYLYNAK